jgi:hypothetical protein
VLETAHKLIGNAWGDEGTTRLQHTWTADPNLIRRLTTGQACYISHGSVTFVQVARPRPSPLTLLPAPVAAEPPAALAAFFDQYVLGHDRAALLTAQLPATAADHADRHARLEAHWRAELARIDTAERALIAELETPADRAAQAYRARIRERYAERYAERTHAEAQLAALQTSAPAQDNDLSLLGELPTAAGLLAGAPERINAALIDAFGIQALYNREDHQITIWASLTEDTPRTIAALLTDPRTDNDTGLSDATPRPAAVHSGPGPIVPRILPLARILPASGTDVICGHRGAWARTVSRAGGRARRRGCSAGCENLLGG